MKEQLLETWITANKVQIFFINQVSDEGMQKSISTRGGRTVFQQLVHIHNTRMQWLEITAKPIFNQYKTLDKEIAFNRELLIASFKDSGKGTEELIEKSWEAGGKLTGFKKGLIPFIGYLIAHEAHHRGHALLTLKQSGIKLSDELKWGLWDWGKM